MTSRPHDALFKAAFESPSGAAALLRELLPPAVRDAIDWDSLDHDRGSFVDESLDDHHSDLLFSARLRAGPPDLVYLLLEHQSTTDPAMPLRWLTYQVRLCDRFRRDRPGAQLPPVIGVLVSHAPGGWTVARTFEEMMHPSVVAIPGLAALLPRCSMILDDLTGQTDDALATRALPPFQKVALWLLRDSRDPTRLLRNLSPDSALASAGLTRLDTHQWAVVVSYLYQVLDPSYQDELRAKLHELSTRCEEAAMTIAEYLEEKGRMKGHQEGLQRGRQEGLRKGRLQGRVDTLRRLLLLKFHALGPEHEARLQAASPEALDRYTERVLTADSLAAVFDG